MSGSSPTVEVSGPLDPVRLSRLAEVQELLAQEAHLLDDRKYGRWLELFADECLYWMPVDPRSSDGTMRLNVFYDDRPRMEARVARLLSGSAFSEEPPSMTARTFSAVLVTEEDGGEEEFAVRSNFMLVAHRAGEQRQLAGRMLHRLRRRDGRLCIAEKRVVLLGSDAPQRPLAFLF